MSNSLELDGRLTRKQLALQLTKHGYPIAAATLQTIATRGGGPAFTIFGHRAIYVWGDALEWAQNLVRQPKARPRHQ